MNLLILLSVGITAIIVTSAQEASQNGEKMILVTSNVCDPPCGSHGICLNNRCICRLNWRSSSNGVTQCDIDVRQAGRDNSRPTRFPQKVALDASGRAGAVCNPGCENSGECLDGKCKCKMPWTGELCQFRVTESLNCDGASKNLACPTGEVFRIDMALFGRRNGDVRNCRGLYPHKKFPCGSYTESKAILKGRCDGKNRCSFAASKSIYPDHCFGIAKYLWYRYHCEPENIKPAGSWATWLPWTDCSRTCGTGSRTRRRACDTLDEDKPCQGSDTENEVCGTQPCDGGADSYYWSRWTPFSQCAPCGNSVKQRSRQCLSYRTGLAVSVNLCGNEPEIEQQRCSLPACSSGTTARPTPAPTRAPTRAPTARPTGPPVINVGDIWGFGAYSDEGKYCKETGQPLKFMTLNDCADACFQWKVCRGITYDKSQSYCYPLKEFCDSNPALQASNLNNMMSYRKLEPFNYQCGQQKCKQSGCRTLGNGKYQCSGNPASKWNKEIIDFDNSLVTDNDCAIKCDQTPGCQSFQWGPSYTEYRLKNDYLECTLFSVEKCTGQRANSNTRHCVKLG